MSKFRQPSDSKTVSELRGEEAANFLRTLHELIEIGTDLAIKAQAEAAARGPDAPASDPDAALKLARINRAVRRGTYLAFKVAEQIIAPDAGRPAEDRVAVRKTIIRGADDTIH